ncbi:MAG: hypothetical protein EXS52_00180 [Candidatus Staskawiczbacteria bacterium]|nr:hypothetical protein [Candidatus Staskawiczbacteria bacterium]
MAKKIYDILPPKVAQKKKLLGQKSGAFRTVKKSAVVSKTQVIQKTRKQERDGVAYIAHTAGKRRFPMKEIFAGSAVMLLLVSIYLYSKLPSADIQVWPVMEHLPLQEKVTVDKSATVVDASKNVIPAQHKEENQDGWQEFLATGDVSTDKKATGTIKIYNKLDLASAFTLIKGTHFLSDAGKYFVITEKVVIPQAQYQKGKLVAGSVSVKVEAEQAGGDYNVGASKFSIPKLSGTTYYYSIYAESTSVMTGGLKGSAKRITKDDIDKARDVLTKKLLGQAETTLRDKLSGEDIIIDNSLLKTVVDFTTTSKADTVVEKFNANATVKVSALVFKKPDLEQFAKNNISSALSQEDMFLEKSLDISYSPVSVDSKKGVAVMDVKLSAKTYKNIDINTLVNLFSQKTGDEIKNLVEENDGIKVSKTEVDFWPFWVNSAPKNKNRINISLIFE